MAATAGVPDELMAWWKTFNNGVIVEEEEEEDSDSEGEEEPDNGREDEEVGAEGASTASTEVDQQRTADAGRTEKEISGASALHGDDAEAIREDGYGQQLQPGGLLRKKMKVAPTRSGIEIQEARGEEDTFHVQKIGRREAIMTRSNLNASGIEIQGGKGEEHPGDSNVQLQDDLVGRRREAIMKMRLARVSPWKYFYRRKEGKDKVSDGTYVDPEVGLRGRKRKATVTPSKLQTTGSEMQDKKGHGECQRAENEMLRRQLVCKMKELDAENIRSLKLKVNVKNKEIKSLKRQIEELRAKNEHYGKKAKLPRKPRLCSFCDKYVLGHDYRSCPERQGHI